MSDLNNPNIPESARLLLQRYAIQVIEQRALIDQLGTALDSLMHEQIDDEDCPFTFEEVAALRAWKEGRDGI